MFRMWSWWISLLLLALSLGWFWVLSMDLRFVRVEPDAKPVPTEAKK